MRLNMTIFSLALLFGSTAFAQLRPNETPIRANESFSVDFEGGLLSDFVDQLEAQLPGMNLIVHTQAENIEVQPLSLRNVNNPRCQSLFLGNLVEMGNSDVEVFFPRSPTLPKIKTVFGSFFWFFLELHRPDLRQQQAIMAISAIIGSSA